MLDQHSWYGGVSVIRRAAVTLRRRFRRWRTQRLLAELDKHQLRDIGLSREDVRTWSERLRKNLADENSAETCRRALGRLNDDELSNLSEAGLRAWRAARHLRT